MFCILQAFVQRDGICKSIFKRSIKVLKISSIKSHIASIAKNKEAFLLTQ